MRGLSKSLDVSHLSSKKVLLSISSHMLVVERHKGRNVDLIRKYPALALYCATAQRRLRTPYINLSPLKDIPSSRDLDRTFRLLRACVRACVASAWLSGAGSGAWSVRSGDQTLGALKQWLCVIPSESFVLRHRPFHDSSVMLPSPCSYKVLLRLKPQRAQSITVLVSFSLENCSIWTLFLIMNLSSISNLSIRWQTDDR